MTLLNHFSQKTASIFTNSINKFKGDHRLNIKIRKLIDLITSRNFALILLGALIALSIIGMSIPQDSPVNQQAYQNWSMKYPSFSNYFGLLGLTNIFTSKLFLFFSFFLFTSTLLCTLRQVKMVKRMFKVLPAIPAASPINLGVFPEDWGLDALSDLLWKNGFHQGSIDMEEGVLQASKYTWGYWGSVVLHLGFVLIMIGIVISSLSKMEGYIYIGEGQTKTEEAQSYWQIKERKFLPGHLGFALTLDNLKIGYSEKNNNIPYTDSLSLTLLDGQKKITKELEGNRFLAYRGIKFFPDSRGYAIALVVTDDKNQSLSGGFFHLRTTFDDPGANYRDAVKKTSIKYQEPIVLPDLGLKITTTFYPDYEIINEVMSTKTWKPDNPALDLVVTKGDQVLYKGPLKLKDKIKIGEYWLNFPEFRNNLGLQVVSDQGTLLIFIGFGVALLGLVLLYLFNPKHIWLKLEPSNKQLLFWSKAQRFPETFQEETNNLASHIKLMI